MASNARKHIIIPEYRPLYAMRECYGPLHGPLNKPCPVPIPVIGKLLRQEGRDKVTIYEVNLNATTGPVQLTLENYQLPYEEILAGGKMSEPSTMEPATPDAEPVGPTIVPPPDPAPASEPAPDAIQETVETKSPAAEPETPDTEPVPEVPMATSVDEGAATPDAEPTSDTAATTSGEETPNGPRTFDNGTMIETIASGNMTKAQKKALKNTVMQRGSK